MILFEGAVRRTEILGTVIGQRRGEPHPHFEQAGAAYSRSVERKNGTARTGMQGVNAAGGFNQVPAFRASLRLARRPDVRSRISALRRR